MVLAGKCTDEAGRRLVALEARYADWVRYLGVLPATQLQPIVHGAAAVVLLSLVDNLPNTCLESMAAGRVVIGTRGASFEQLIENGRSGFLVPLGDAAALQLAMARAWHMGDAERAQMGSAAKGRIAQLRPDIAVARLESFYTAVIAGSRTARRESVVAH